MTRLGVRGPKPGTPFSAVVEHRHGAHMMRNSNFADKSMDLQLHGLVICCVCHHEIPEKHLESCMTEFSTYELGIMLTYL